MSLTRIGSIGINTGIAFAGVTTIVTLNTANDALSIGATVNVGSGITLGASGDVFFTGIATGNGSGLTALNASNISSGTVPTARLGSGTASSSTFLRGDSTFQTVNTDLVSDTSPQLGGDLASNGNNINMADDDIINVGSGNDLRIRHNGSNSLIEDVGTGNLQIRGDDVHITGTNDEILAKFIENTGVELYHDGSSKKFETTSSGASVTGTLDVSNALNVTGLTTLNDSLIMGDNVIAKFGAGSDLRIYHDGNDSYIDDAGVGSLLLRTTTGSNVTIKSTNDVMAKFKTADSVELYYNNLKRIETHTQGAAIGQVSTIPSMTDFSCQILAGNSGFIGNYHSGSNQQFILGLNQYYDSGNYKAPDNNVSQQLQFYNKKFNFITAPAPGSDNGAVTNTNILTIDEDGVKFGTDTASANALDDYEEGTFTATCGNSVTLYSTEDLCAYTKIGRQVTVRGQVRINNDNGNADFTLNGLPFANVNDGEGSNPSIGAVRTWGINFGGGDTNGVIAFVAGTNSHIEFWRNINNGGAERVDAKANGYVAFTVTYFTSA